MKWTDVLVRGWKGVYRGQFESSEIWENYECSVAFPLRCMKLKRIGQMWAFLKIMQVLHYKYVICTSPYKRIPLHAGFMVEVELARIVKTHTSQMLWYMTKILLGKQCKLFSRTYPNITTNLSLRKKKYRDGMAPRWPALPPTVQVRNQWTLHDIFLAFQYHVDLLRSTKLLAKASSIEVCATTPAALLFSEYKWNPRKHVTQFARACHSWPLEFAKTI